MTEAARATRRDKRRKTCKRGCATALKRLGSIFKQVGTHTGKTAQHRRSSYPNPKKGKSTKNLTSKYHQPPPQPHIFVPKLAIAWSYLILLYA